MIESQNLDRLPGMNVVGTDGESIGKIDEVYVDDATGEPSFALVNTGLFGLKSSFVPLDQAEIAGEDVKVAATKDKVKDAPNMDPDGHLSPDEEDELYRYYGLESHGQRTTAAGDTSGMAGTEATAGTAGMAGTADRDATADVGTSAGMSGTADTDVTAGTAGGAGTAGTAGMSTDAENEHGTVGRDTSGPTTDDAMTRSEEELHVGTRQKEIGKARLRKHVVTEHVTKTVPVQREEVTIEREPVDEDDIDKATEGPAISEEEHEVTLHEEVPVVEKRTVPKERVRLEKEVHTDEVTVEDDIQKEEIDLAGLEDSRHDQER